MIVLVKSKTNEQCQCKQQTFLLVTKLLLLLKFLYEKPFQRNRLRE